MARKIESKANKYTFVWRKSVEKNRAKLQEKIRALLQQVDEAAAQDKSGENPSVEFTPSMLSDIANELREALEQEPETKDKEEKNMNRIRTKRGKTESGYVTESARYKAQDAKDVRYAEVALKRRTRERLTCEEGIKHRGRRCIEPEAVFGQMKYNMAYRRFRHFGKDKVTMDFAFFAIAFNIKKLCAKLVKAGNGTLLASIIMLFRLFPAPYGLSLSISHEINKKIAT